MSKGYAALLRGINVGGRKQVSMPALREVLSDLGLGDVRTYLQSGNAVFSSPPADDTALARQVADAVEAHFGFGVDVVVRDHDYLAAVVDACPFPAASLEGKQLHVTYFSDPVDESGYAALDPARYLPEEFRLGDRALYLYAPHGLGRSKLAEALTRSGPPKGVVATSRNWNTAVKLVELTRG